MRMILIPAAGLAFIMAGCPRADAPDHADTAGVEMPPDARFPPAVAPGDTSPVVQPPAAAPDTPPRARPPATVPPRPAEDPDMTPAPADTLRGRVIVTGAAPMTTVMLQREGDAYVTLHGSADVMRGLRSVQGSEIWVTGRTTGQRELRVDRFEMRAVDGVAAVDGVLHREGDEYQLVTHDGRRHRIAYLPEALRDRVGSRIWLAGPLDRPPEAFGVIE